MLRKALLAGGILSSLLCRDERLRADAVARLQLRRSDGQRTIRDRVGADLSTPWVGIWERINIGVFLLWVVVLAITLLPAGDGDMTPGRQGARPA